MNREMQGLVAVIAMAASLPAHAQLRSVDGGAAALDASGLMWANIVGINLGWSPRGGPGGAFDWVSGLNARDYGGYDDWTLATGDGSVAANPLSNQLGQLFYTDCGNSLGTLTAMNNAGKNCSALSAVSNANARGTGLGPPGSNPNNALYFSTSPWLQQPPCEGGCIDKFFWSYDTSNSSQRVWTNDTSYDGIVGEGNILAVRAVPEIDSTSAAGCLALLFGILAVLRGRIRVSA